MSDPESNRTDFLVHGTYEMQPKPCEVYEAYCIRPGEHFQVYVNPDTLGDAWGHALLGLDKQIEIGGALIGCLYRDKENEVDFVEITDIERLKSTGSSVHVEIPPDEWARMNANIDSAPLYRGKYSIIGWYHSHPNMRAFMSNTDAQTQSLYFSHYGMVALVLGGNELNPEIRCFDHQSQEVPLYFIPQRGDTALRPARGRAIKSLLRTMMSEHDEGASLKMLSAKIDFLTEELKKTRELIDSLRDDVHDLHDSQPRSDVAK